VRIINEGAVRLEVIQASGLSQISPEQLPQSDAAKAFFQAPANQVFAYRFSGAGYALRLQADNVLPELSISEVALYHLGENELAIDAELEVDVREAPLRELVLLIRVASRSRAQRLRPERLLRFRPGSGSRLRGRPAGVGPAVDKGVSQLRLVFATPVSGRQVIQLRLERNQPLQDTSWALPRLEIPKAKSVRGHLAVSADAGFRSRPQPHRG